MSCFLMDQDQVQTHLQHASKEGLLFVGKSAGSTVSFAHEYIRRASMECMASKEDQIGLSLRVVTSRFHKCNEQ